MSLQSGSGASVKGLRPPARSRKWQVDITTAAEGLAPTARGEGARPLVHACVFSRVLGFRRWRATTTWRLTCFLCFDTLKALECSVSFGRGSVASPPRLNICRCRRTEGNLRSRRCSTKKESEQPITLRSLRRGRGLERDEKLLNRCSCCQLGGMRERAARSVSSVRLLTRPTC